MFDLGAGGVSMGSIFIATKEAPFLRNIKTHVSILAQKTLC